MSDFSPYGIFNSDFDFNHQAILLFKIQAAHNRVYSEYLNLIRVNPEDVKSADQIPFLPIEFFKTHDVVTGFDFGFGNPPIEFISSGTTGSPSHHFIRPQWYEDVCLKNFERFYGNVKDYAILALLPSYLEQKSSSLVFMMNHLIQSGGHKESGFYLSNYHELIEQLKKLKSSSKKIWLMGVTYALFDLAETIEQNGMGKLFSDYEQLVLMETGGMKGRRKEMVRDEVHSILKEKTGICQVHSEYGMTELMSQAYSKSDGKFFSPPWMKLSIRHINDPLANESAGKTGAINIMDLANLNSCAFIATHDLGIVYADGSFEITGRMDNSDLRGCNLLIS